VRTQQQERYTMAKSKTALELWATRFGPSARVVKRTKTGQFVDNKSFGQLLKV